MRPMHMFLLILFSLHIHYSSQQPRPDTARNSLRTMDHQPRPVASRATQPSHPPPPHLRPAVVGARHAGRFERQRPGAARDPSAIPTRRPRYFSQAAINQRIRDYRQRRSRVDVSAAADLRDMLRKRRGLQPAQRFGPDPMPTGTGRARVTRATTVSHRRREGPALLPPSTRRRTQAQAAPWRQPVPSPDPPLEPPTRDHGPAAGTREELTAELFHLLDSRHGGRLAAEDLRPFAVATGWTWPQDQEPATAWAGYFSVLCRDFGCDPAAGFDLGSFSSMVNE